MNSCLHLEIRSRICLALTLSVLALSAVTSRADDKPSAAQPAASDVPAGVSAFVVPVPDSSTPLKAVHAAVVQAALKHEWTIKENSANRVVIHLTHREKDATVTFLITTESVSAYCEGYAIDGNGARIRPEQPARWLKNLKVDITKSLSRSAALLAE